MDIIWKLTIRELKQKKKRTFSVLFGISASSFLLTAAVIFIHSMIQKMSGLHAIGEDSQKLVVGAGVLMAAILASLTLFIYHILSVSAVEKIRQLGILGSVGATPFQRARLMLLETLILSVIGLPIGLLSGILFSWLTFPFVVVVSWNTLFLLLVFEALVIMITGLIHAYSSLKGNVIQLLLNRTEKRKINKNWKAPKWVGKYFGVEGELAAKNIYFFRRRYGIIAVSFIVSMILVLDGSIYLNYLDGKYEPKDPCIKNYADIVLEKTGPKDENWMLFTEEVSRMKEIEEVVKMEELKLGDVLFQKSEIKEDFHTFTSYSSASGAYDNPVVLNSNNKDKQEGYYMGLTLIGMDDAAFSRYQKQLGAANETYNIQSGIPVIIHDMVFMRKDNETKYGQIFDLKEGQTFSVSADRNGSSFGAHYSANQIEEFSEYQFQTVAVTDELPSCYNIISEQMRDSNEIFFFTPQSFLDEFLQTNKASKATETRNHLQVSEEREGWMNTKFLCLKVKNDVKLPPQIISKKIITGTDFWRSEFKLNDEYLNTRKGDELRKLIKRYSKQISIVTENIANISEKYDLTNPYDIDINDEQWYEKSDYTFNHYPGWIEVTLSDPQPALRHLFTYTLLVFLMIIGIFQMIKMMISTTNIRRREFAVMLSLGMEPVCIRKIVCMESIFCLLLSYIIGSISSIAVGFYLFRHWTQTQALEIHFPYILLVLEFLFLIFLIVLMLCISVKAVKKIKIADLLKDDTV